MNIVLFEPSEIQQPLSVRDGRGKHILRVLHKKSGDTFEAGIINGRAGICTIDSVHDDRIFFTFVPGADTAPLLPVKMLIGFPRPIQLKRLLRDIVSFGVEEIHLTATDLGDKSYLNSTLLDRGAARRDMIDGCAQAKTTALPLLVYHQSLEAALAALADCRGTRILLDTAETAQPLSSFAVTDVPLLLAVGSERGWTDRERALFREQGFAACSLGRRILRTETACTAAAVLAAARAGLI